MEKMGIARRVESVTRDDTASVLRPRWEVMIRGWRDVRRALVIAKVSTGDRPAGETGTGSFMDKESYKVGGISSSITSRRAQR